MDINGDGRQDILSGSYAMSGEAGVGLFQVLYGQEDGSFAKAVPLKGTDGKNLIIHKKGRTGRASMCTRPTAVDWNGDGNLDLVVGNFREVFFLFIGEGKGRFGPDPQLIRHTNRKPVALLGTSTGKVFYSDPFPIDWDSDGDLDLISGSIFGDVQWAENVAGPGALPNLKPFVYLIASENKEVGLPLLDFTNFKCSISDLVKPKKTSRVWVDDINGDGKLDILVGDSASLADQKDSSITEGEYKKLAAELIQEWNSVFTQMGKVDDEPEEGDSYSEKIIGIHSKYHEIVHEEKTGFVWLYLQK